MFDKGVLLDIEYELENVETFLRRANDYLPGAEDGDKYELEQFKINCENIVKSANSIGESLEVLDE